MAKVNFALPRATHIQRVDAQELWGDAPPPPVDPESGMPEKLTAYLVSHDPKITVIPYCLSGAECDHLLQLVEGHWMPSLVGGADQSATTSIPTGARDGGLQNKISENRTSWSCQTRYVQTEVLERLEHRLASVAGLPVGQLERLNLVRYAPGECFNEHHDGKFRPRTVFVYLNDLEGDAAGDTFFPVLGLSFRPRKGTAVVWPNATAEGQEDSRMLHAGRPPLQGVKYGVNCFFNEQPLRGIATAPDLPESIVYNLASLAEAVGTAAATLTVHRLCDDPRLSAVPGLLSGEEVAELLRLVEGAEQGCGEQERGGPFCAGTQTLCIVEDGGSNALELMEARMCAVAGYSLPHLARLRIVRPGTRVGLCNRGSGHAALYACLGEREEVLYPKLGLRLVLRSGDALVWSNVTPDEETGRVVEDLRVVRAHTCVDRRAIGVDAFFHENPVREQQRQRRFVADVEASLKPVVVDTSSATQDTAPPAASLHGR